MLTLAVHAAGSSGCGQRQTLGNGRAVEGGVDYCRKFTQNAKNRRGRRGLFLKRRGKSRILLFPLGPGLSANVLLFFSRYSIGWYA